MERAKEGEEKEEGEEGPGEWGASDACRAYGLACEGSQVGTLALRE